MFLLLAGELLTATGVAGLLFPHLLPALGFLADLLFLSLVIASLSLAMTFIGTGFRAGLNRGTSEVLGRDALFLSGQGVSIAAGIAVARSGLNPPVAVGAGAVGLACVTAYLLGRRKD